MASVGLALLAGAAIGLQANLNARLGVLLGNPLLASAVAFACSATCVTAVWVSGGSALPESDVLRRVPPYLWLAGGALAALGVALTYHLIPRVGLGPVMSLVLTAQVSVALATSHFGWLGMPVRELNLLRTCGWLAVVGGVVALNWEA